LLFYPLFGIGAVVALQVSRVQRVVAEVALDGVLIVAAGTAVVIRTGLEPLAARPALSAAEFHALLAGMLGSVAALFLAGRLVLSQASSSSGRDAGALLGAPVAFVFAQVLDATWTAARTVQPGGLHDLPAIVGWAFLTYAGITGVKSAGRPQSDLIQSRIARRMRQAVVPAAALFLGLLGLDAALRPAVGVE